MIAYALGFLLICGVIYGQSWIIEFAIIKRVMDSPANGFMVSLLASGLLTIIWLAWWLGFSPGVVVLPLVATGVIFVLNLRQYRRLRKAEHVDADIFQ